MKAAVVVSHVIQDSAGALAPAESVGSGPEGASTSESAGLERKLHPADRHPPGLQPGPARSIKLTHTHTHTPTHTHTHTQGYLVYI